MEILSSEATYFWLYALCSVLMQNISGPRFEPPQCFHLARSSYRWYMCENKENWCCVTVFRITQCFHFLHVIILPYCYVVQIIEFAYLSLTFSMHPFVISCSCMLFLPAVFHANQSKVQEKFTFSHLWDISTLLRVKVMPYKSYLPRFIPFLRSSKYEHWYVTYFRPRTI